MKKSTATYLYTFSLVLMTMFSENVFSEQATESMDILSGYFSREGNNGSPAKKTNNNIYIKLYPEQWITVLYIPFDYATTLDSEIINKVLNKVELQSESGSFTRSKFGILEEAATAHVEKYEIIEGQLQFQCGSINPCAIRFYDNYLELVKSGIINEHIIKFDHILK